ncbi:MAG: hypothetical protein FWE31_01790 [Firmicutes bacterium]|nr:hypothetical protein [Bacillota bacterium]
MRKFLMTFVALVMITTPVLLLTACGGENGGTPAYTLTLDPTSVAISDSNLSTTITVSGTATGDVLLSTSALPSGIAATVDGTTITVTGTRPATQGASVTGTHNVIVTRGGVSSTLTVNANLTTTYTPSGNIPAPTIQFGWEGQPLLSVFRQVVWQTIDENEEFLIRATVNGNTFYSDGWGVSWTPIEGFRHFDAAFRNLPWWTTQESVGDLATLDNRFLERFPAGDVTFNVRRIQNSEMSNWSNSLVWTEQMRTAQIPGGLSINNNVLSWTPIVDPLGGTVPVGGLWFRLTFNGGVAYAQHYVHNALAITEINLLDLTWVDSLGTNTTNPVAIPNGILTLEVLCRPVGYLHHLPSGWSAPVSWTQTTSLESVQGFTAQIQNNGSWLLSWSSTERTGFEYIIRVVSGASVGYIRVDSNNTPGNRTFTVLLNHIYATAPHRVATGGGLNDDFGHGNNQGSRSISFRLDDGARVSIRAQQREWRAIPPSGEQRYRTAAISPWVGSFEWNNPISTPSNFVLSQELPMFTVSWDSSESTGVEYVIRVVSNGVTRFMRIASSLDATQRTVSFGWNVSSGTFWTTIDDNQSGALIIAQGAEISMRTQVRGVLPNQRGTVILYTEWTEPQIVVVPSVPAGLEITNNTGGRTHLAWDSLQYTGNSGEYIIRVKIGETTRYLRSTQGSQIFTTRTLDFSNAMQSWLTSPSATNASGALVMQEGAEISVRFQIRTTGGLTAGIHFYSDWSVPVIWTPVI